MRLLLSVFVLVAVLAADAGGATKQPVEGTWAWATGGGTVTIAAAGPGTFVGKVAQPAVDSTCGRVLMPAGFAAWQLTGSGTSYQGTFAAFNSCKRSPGDGQATWTVKNQAGKLRLAFCITKTGDPPGMEMSPPMCSDLIAVGATDTEAPGVKAYPTQGARGTAIKLRWNVADDSGKSREQLTVRQGSAELLRRTIALHAVQKDLRFSGGFFSRWNAPQLKGALTFCVQAWDAAGNASKPSCARLTLR